jgi:hypothetical protein
VYLDVLEDLGVDAASTEMTPDDLYLYAHCLADAVLSADLQ